MSGWLFVQSLTLVRSLSHRTGASDFSSRLYNRYLAARDEILVSDLRIVDKPFTFWFPVHVHCLYTVIVRPNMYIFNSAHDLVTEFMLSEAQACCCLRAQLSNDLLNGWHVRIQHAPRCRVHPIPIRAVLPNTGSWH